MINRDIFVSKVEDLLMNVISKDVKNNIIMLTSNRVNKNIVASVLNRQVDIDLLSDNALFFISEAVLYSFQQDKRLKYLVSTIKLTDYFTNIEIEQYRMTKELEVDKDIVVIENVYMVDDSYFMCVSIEAQDLINLFSSLNITYNFETQRESIQRKVGNEVYSLIKTNKESIKDISNKMLEGNYIATPISFNLLRDTEVDNSFVYDEENHCLHLSKSNRLDILDGMHRSKALMLALRKDHNLKQVMQINFFNYSVQQAQQYISQQSKLNKIESSLLKAFEISPINTLIDEINNEGNSITNVLYKNIVNSKDEVRYRGIVHKSYLYETLEWNYGDVDIKNMRDRRRLKEYIVAFMNEVQGILVEVDKGSLIKQQYLYPIYVGLSKKLYKKDKWEKILEDILLCIDFESDDIITLLKTNIMSKKTLRKVDNYINEVIKRANISL